MLNINFRSAVLLILISFATIWALEGNYLIITEPQWENNSSLQDFVSWRQNRFNVTLVTTDVTGNTKSEIETYIKTKHETDSLSYLLFVGSPWSATGIPYDPSAFGAPTYTTYGQIDKDAFFITGETTQRPTLVISVGVFPVRNGDELANIVSKTIATENNITNQPSNIAIFGNNVEGGFITNVANTTTNWNTYLTDPTVSLSDLFPSNPSSLINLVNSNKLRLITYFGHGLHGSWDGSWNTEGSFNCDKVSQLTNNTVYPMVISGSCYTASFIDSTPSLGESWITSANGASIYVGNRHGIGLNATYSFMASIPQFYNDESIRTVGELIEAARNATLSQANDPYYQGGMYEYPGIFGDPALLFKSDGAVSLKSGIKNNAADIKPNIIGRSANTLVFRIPSGSGWQVKVISPRGRVLHKTDLKALNGMATLALPQLSRGIYFIILKSRRDTFSYTFKW